MPYSGSATAQRTREELGRALAALQEDPNIPPDVLAVAQNIAQAVGALFEAGQAKSEPDGKSSVKAAIGSLSQTLALLQDVRQQHKGITVATEVIAKAMSALYPLTVVPTKAPSGSMPAVQNAYAVPKAPPAVAGAAPVARPPVDPNAKRANVEANIGATTESNFFVGFSGEIAEGGVFVATYETVGKGTPVDLLVTLPGGFETRLCGYVKFVRDPLDMTADSEPGMGVAFDALAADQRELILRFIRKRPPIFYDE